MCRETFLWLWASHSAFLGGISFSRNEWWGQLTSGVFPAYSSPLPLRLGRCGLQNGTPGTGAVFQTAVDAQICIKTGHLAKLEVTSSPAGQHLRNLPGVDSFFLRVDSWLCCWGTSGLASPPGGHSSSLCMEKGPVQAWERFSCPTDWVVIFRAKRGRMLGARKRTHAGRTSLW